MDTVLQFSLTIDKIAKALILAQGNMGSVVKKSENPHFKSKYADLDTVIDATRPALQAQGIAVIQAAGGDGAVITIETMFLHESGEWIRSTLGLRPSKADPQGAGSAITYGRRYSLMAMCGLAPEDDDGNLASKTTKPAAVPSHSRAQSSFKAPLHSVAGASETQRILAMTLCSKLGFSAEERYDFYESVAGYTDGGEPIRSWDMVSANGKASRVIDALQAEAGKLQEAGL